MSKPSRGFVAVELELLEAEISDAALQLLLRLRKDCAQHESDGAIDRRTLAAVAAYSGLTGRLTKRCVAELIACDLLAETADGFQDTGYLTWNTTRERREQHRADARRRQQKHRESFKADITQGVTADVTRDSQRESRPLQEQEQAHEEVTLPVAPPAAGHEGDVRMLRQRLAQERAQEVVQHWSRLTGKPTSMKDGAATAEFAIPMPHLLDALDRCHGAGVYSLAGCRMTLQRLESEVRKRPGDRLGPVSLGERVAALVPAA